MARAVPYETAIQQWRAGERRVDNASPRQQRVYDRVVSAIVAELRRRLGGPFSTSELVALYERDGTDWTMEQAHRGAPEDPWA